MDVKTWLEENAPRACRALAMFEQELAAVEIARQREAHADSQRFGRFQVWANLIAAHAAGMIVIEELAKRVAHAESALEAVGIRESQAEIAKARIGIITAIGVELKVRLDAIKAKIAELTLELGIKSVSSDRVENALEDTLARSMR